LAGISLLEPAAGFGVVVVVEWHSPSEPRAKSNSVAVRDCEERVSPTKVLKHLPERPVVVRLMPPSKNSPGSSVLPSPVVLPLLFVSHGVWIVPVFAVAQMLSPP